MIKKANVDDLNKIVMLASKLYGESDKNVLYKEFSEYVQREDCLILLAEKENVVMGFAHIAIRKDYVEGCDTFNVAYLEGVYVEETFRNKGLANRFIKAGIEWARLQNCTEFASDCELKNVDSIAFHKAVGFEEVNRIVCFKKKI